MKVDIMQEKGANLQSVFYKVGFEVEDFDDGLFAFRIFGITNVSYKHNLSQPTPYIEIEGCEKGVTIPLRMIKELNVSVL